MSLLQHGAACSAQPNPQPNPNTANAICKPEAFSHIKKEIQDNAEEASYNPWKVLNDAFRSVGPLLAQKYGNDMLRRLSEC